MKRECKHEIPFDFLDFLKFMNFNLVNWVQMSIVEFDWIDWVVTRQLPFSRFQTLFFFFSSVFFFFYFRVREHKYVNRVAISIDLRVYNIDVNHDLNLILSLENRQKLQLKTTVWNLSNSTCAQYIHAISIIAKEYKRQRLSVIQFVFFFSSHPSQRMCK